MLADKNFRLVLMICIFTLMLTACSSSTVKTENNAVAAFVNGQEITMNDIQQKIAVQDVNLEMQKQVEKLLEDEGMRIPNEQDQNDIDDYLSHSGFDLSDMTKDEERYYNRTKRELKRNNSNLTKNEAFNLLVREEVLYQEARRQGLAISLKEARDKYQQLEERQLVGWENMDLRKEIEAIEDESAKRLGYNSREERMQDDLLDFQKRASRHSLSQWFQERLGKKLPEVQNLQFRILAGNAWEDYTDYLLRQSGIEIKQDGLNVIYYGEEWQEDMLASSEQDADSLIKQAAAFTIIGSNGTKELLTETADIMQQRLKKLGVKNMVITIGSDIRVEQAYWKQEIPWKTISSRGMLEIGDGDLKINNSQLKSVEVIVDRPGNVKQISILLKLTEEGSKILAQLTEENLKRELPIYLDGQVLLAPKVAGPITSGSFKLYLGKLKEEAEIEALASVLATKTLPLAVNYSS